MKPFLPIFAFILCASISPAAEPPSVQTSRLLDTYGGSTDLKGEKTGFFHTEKIDGRWWLKAFLLKNPAVNNR